MSFRVLRFEAARLSTIHTCEDTEEDEPKQWERDNPFEWQEPHDEPEPAEMGAGIAVSGTKRLHWITQP